MLPFGRFAKPAITTIASKGIPTLSAKASSRTLSPHVPHFGPMSNQERFRSGRTYRRPVTGSGALTYFVGEPDAEGHPDIAKCRLAVENKSVITAHRNRTNRFDDLKKVVAAIQGERPEALLIATVLVGLAERVLNIPDQVHKFYRGREEEFGRSVRPRLSTGDESLFEEFNWAISNNRSSEPRKTLELFQSLPTRGSAQTHLTAYDSVLLVPVRIDNVHPPELPRPNELGIDVDAEYAAFLDRTCKAYTARWHM